MLRKLLYSKWSALVIILLALSNIILVSMLFYKLIPQLTITLNNTAAKSVMSSVMTTSSADAGSVWAVNLQNSTRQILTFSLKNEKDAPGFKDFIGDGGSKPLMIGLPTRVIYALLEHKSICTRIDANSFSTLEIKNFSETLGLTEECFIPIRAANGVLIGFVSVFWKNTLAPEIRDLMISQTEITIKDKFK